MKKLLVMLAAVMLVVCLAVSAGAAEFVYYENDFSDEATLADFTQLRGEWGIVDGQLRLVDLGELGLTDQAFLIYTKDEGIMNLTDYVLEVDMFNIQTQAGPIFRCDVTKANGTLNNSFFGYQAFLSFTGEKGALGRGNLLGEWGGNLIVSENVTTPGSNLHLKVTAEGKTITYVMTDLDTNAESWTTSLDNDEYALGSFGFRAVAFNNGITNLNTLGFDNLKITAIGEVGDHLASGKTLSEYAPSVVSGAVMPQITPALEVTVPEVVTVKAEDLDMTKTEYVYYENDFSDAATIADFTQYRGEWAIKDGKLYYVAQTDGFKEVSNFTFILFSKDHDANLLSNYTIEADILGSNSFYGYTAFISNDGKKPAIGYGNTEGAWGGNLVVGDGILTPGSDYHLKAEHKDGMLTYTVTLVGSDEVIWTYSEPDVDWAAGSFGFRMRATNDTLINLDNVGIDNLKVVVHGDQAVLLNAGYHPNAVIDNGEVETTAPAETDAPEATEAPEESTAAPEVAETTAAPTAEEEAGVNIGLVIGIVAAVIVVVAVVAVVIKKKK